jgi:hypothetical protein
MPWDALWDIEKKVHLPIVKVDLLSLIEHPLGQLKLCRCQTIASASFVVTRLSRLHAL